MRLRHSFLLLLAVSFFGCRIPLFPTHIRMEKCELVPSERLFNKDQFAPKDSRAELVVIRDVGYEGADFYLPVTIDSVHFADMRVWEKATASLAPGTHKITFEEPAPLISLGKRPVNSLEIEVTTGSRSIIRIDLGRKYPAIRRSQD